MRRIGTGLALTALAWLSIAHALHSPAPVPASAPATEFSAERAMRHVRAIAAGPHATGTPGHARVLAYLQAEIRALGLTPVIQDATGVGTRYAVAGRVRNVMVRVRGTKPGKAVLLVSHYDGVAAGPAAADAGSGTAALLETMRALRAGPPLRNDVIALWTDAEEAGLLGAAAFAREHPWAKDVGVILNFEARGVRGPSLMFQTGEGNLDVVRVLRSVPGARATSLSTTVYRRLPNDTDLSELSVLGQPGLNFAFIGGVDRYHTTEDDAEHLSARSLQHHGVQALGLARRFGDEPLPRATTPDAVFFAVPVLGLVVYRESLAVPLAILALACVVGAAIRRRTQQRWLVSLIAGAAVALVTVALGASIGFVAGARLLDLHQALGSGTPRWSTWYAASIAMLAIAGVLLGSALARRIGGLWHSGALLVWGCASLLVGWFLPGASFLFTWPVLAAATAELVAAKPASRTRDALSGLSATVAVVLIVPTAYLMVIEALGLDATGGALIGVLLAMTATIAAPLLLHVAGERLWRPAAAAAAAAIVAALIGAGTVRTDAARPAAAAIGYITSADSGRAWVSGTSSEPAQRWLQSVLDAARVDSAPAPVWVRRAAGGRLAVRTNSVTPAPGGATARVLRDSSAGPERHLTLRIRPAAGTEAIALSLDTVVISASVDGRRIDRSGYRRSQVRWSIEFFAPPDSGFTLGLTLPAGAAASLNMVSRFPGFPRIPGVSVPARPPGVLAIQSGDVTLVHRTVALRAR